MTRLFIDLILIAVVAGGFLYPHHIMANENKLNTGTPKLMLSLTTGKNPEAVLFDQDRQQYFVSLMNFKVQTGGGGIAVLDQKGAIKDLDWVSGLNQPKGMVINGDKLYVADIKEFIEIDIPSATITNKYSSKDGIFLNDPAVGPDGSVYVTDSLMDSIFRLSPDGSYELWVKDERLESPNGAVVYGEHLYIASWGLSVGKTVRSMLEAKRTGKLVRIRLADKSIEVLSKGPVGHLDGIEPDGNGNFFISDWFSGEIFLISSTGKTLAEYDMAKIMGVESAGGLADIEYMESKKEIWAPMMRDGTVLVFSVAK